jgi:hypothetical protein
MTRGKYFVALGLIFFIAVLIAVLHVASGVQTAEKTNIDAPGVSEPVAQARNNEEVAKRLAGVGVTQPKPAVAASDQTGTIHFGEMPIQISIGEIGKDDEGNTTVQVFMDFEVLMQGLDAGAVLQGAMQAIRVKIVAQNKPFEQNKTFEAYKLSIDGGWGGMTPAANGMSKAKINHLVYYFVTAASPEKIIIYNKQDPGLTFSGETKKIID